MRDLTRFACAVVVLSLTFAAAATPGGKPSSDTHECFYRDAIDGCTLSATSDVNIFGCESEGYYFNVHRVLLSAALTYTFSLKANGSSYSPFIGISHEDSDVFFVTKEGSRGGTVTVTYNHPRTTFTRSSSAPRNVSPRARSGSPGPANQRVRHLSRPARPRRPTSV